METKTNTDFENYIDYLIEVSGQIKAKKITILTGRNAGGKSLIRKLLSPSITKQLKKKSVLIPHASQELRTKTNESMGALSGMAHDLEWLATSDNTISVIDTVFNQEKADFIVIDEPEIGMGEELQLGMADYINEKNKVYGKGILIITHSKHIVRNIKHDVFINLEKMTKDEWLNREPVKMPIEEFNIFATELFKTVRDRINKNKDK